MEFLIWLALCIAGAQAGLLAGPVATYSAVAPVRYAAFPAPLPVHRAPVTAFAAVEEVGAT